MSGILDNKSKVIDAILTYEGRRQMIDGKFVVSYVSFSDRSVVYQTDSVDGHVDATSKLYLEAFNAPYDQIIFESDDSGRLVPFRQHSVINETGVTGSMSSSISWTTFMNGQIQTKKQNLSVLNYTGSYSQNTISGSKFASQMEGILTSSIDNFRSHYILGSTDVIFEDQEFGLSRNEIQFTLPVNNETISMKKPTSVNTIDSLFNDEKLRNVDNFRYLPPIKKTNFTIDKTDIGRLDEANLLLGNYPPWGPVDPLTFSEIIREVSGYEFKEITFDPTSKDNQLVGQFFEINESSVTKLDVIDYGKVNDNTANPYADTHHVFFVGKIATDDSGTDCFIHMFTLIFDSGEEL